MEFVSTYKYTGIDTDTDTDLDTDTDTAFDRDRDVLTCVYDCTVNRP
jgi:hypothetical protein